MGHFISLFILLCLFYFILLFIFIFILLLYFIRYFLFLSFFKTGETRNKLLDTSLFVTLTWAILYYFLFEIFIFLIIGNYV